MVKKKKANIKKLKEKGIKLGYIIKWISGGFLIYGILIIFLKSFTSRENLFLTIIILLLIDRYISKEDKE